MLHKGERGQNLVLLALALPLLLGMVALGIDGGYGYAQRLRMQTSADAAALAGARALALGMTPVQVDAAVTKYATDNGALEFSWSLVGFDQGVQVTAQVSWDTFFAGVIGMPTMTASATATSSIDYLSSAGSLLPIALFDQPFTFGQPYTLWDDDQHAPGSFGWLDWDGPGGGASQLAYNINHPDSSGTWSIGDLVPPKTGVVASGQVLQALDLWLGKNVTVPIYDQVTGQGAGTRYRICGFAEFVMTSYVFQGSEKHIDGYFIRWIESGPGGGPQGVRTVRLTQ